MLQKVNKPRPAPPKPVMLYVDEWGTPHMTVSRYGGDRQVMYYPKKSRKGRS